MGASWNLTLPERREKSYVRKNYYRNSIYAFLRYKAVNVNIAKLEGRKTYMTDTLADQMLAHGVITSTQLEDYHRQVCDRYFFKDCYPEESPEETYGHIARIRTHVFGGAAMAKARELQRQQPPKFEPEKGIDQRNYKEKCLEAAEGILFILTQSELFSLMEKDVKTVISQGKTAYVCVGGEEGDLPDQQQMSDWLRDCHSVRYVQVRSGRLAEEGEWPQSLAIFFYGEDGFLHLRAMAVDSIVHAIPTGYHAQALCNSLGAQCPCVVYIPKGLDITDYVPLRKRTRLSFRHLARLSRREGQKIYEMTPRELYQAFPRDFVNIYDNGQTLPPITAAGETFEDFDASRDAAVEKYLSTFSNIRYRAAYFDAEGKEQPISYNEEQENTGILVHSVRVTRAKNTRVLPAVKGQPLRSVLGGLSGTAVASNFLFFLTPKLDVLYNDLRADRPLEQADAAAGHLDYMLQNGPERKETFPLFAKTCIAMTQEGEFHFFPFRLGGGEVTVCGRKLRWESADVDPRNPGNICIYTPFYSAGEEDADRQTYRCPVGAQRVNFVILQDRITCVRSGDVLLPSVGVVLSLTEELAAPLLGDLQPLENGYFDPAKLDLQVHLDPPKNVSLDLWQKLRWVYGGGMTLIQDGECPQDPEELQQCFRREGWMTPLSRQSQESPLHKSVKAPRTAIGTTENDELVILVFSGRSERSSGANYEEMIHIAKTMYPDIKNLINGDGGSSAVLGMAYDESFMELSVPATSTGGCIGMVRPVHTLFYLPAEKETL